MDEIKQLKGQLLQEMAVLCEGALSCVKSHVNVETGNAITGEQMEGFVYLAVQVKCSIQYVTKYLFLITGILYYSTFICVYGAK